MRNSYKIALSGITVALSMVFITAAYFLSFMSLPFLALSSMCLLIPLSKKLYVYAGLCALAAALFSFLYPAGLMTILIPYAIFFGIHPIITIVLNNVKLNKIIASVIKQVFFNIALVSIYFILKEIFPEFLENRVLEFVLDNVVWVWLLANLFFYFYDDLFLRLSKRLSNYINKIIK